MENHRIGTIINFCTNESRFIRSCIEEAKVFSQQIIVVVASHFFDGTPENRQLLGQIYRAFPDVQFIEYPFLPDLIPKRVFKAVRPENFWHCISRLIGFSFLEEEIDWALFLDADEIAEGASFSEWLDCSGYECYSILKLANFWYFREPIYRAKPLEDSIVFLPKKTLEPDLLLNSLERDALYDSLPGPKRRMVMGNERKPMFHHFSWVRTENEMLKKVKSWGHKKDRNWEQLVKEEFLAPFKGKDFVHGYEFETVESRFQMNSVFEGTGLSRSNVLYLSAKDLVKFAKMKPISFWASFFRREQTLRSYIPK